MPKSADNRAGLLRRYYRTAMMITPAGNRNPQRPDLDAGKRAGRRRIGTAGSTPSATDATDPSRVLLVLFSVLPGAVGAAKAVCVPESIRRSR